MKSQVWITGLAAAVVLAGAARADGPDLAKAFESLLPGMENEQSQQAWQRACWTAGAPGREGERAEACRLMAAKLPVEGRAPVRVWLLKQLERIGREESVDAIAACLADPDKLVRDAAVRAIANNPAPAAGDKLRAAMAEATGPAKLALIDALGFRAEPASIQALARELKTSRGPQARAAAHALGRIGTPETVEVLESALGPDPAVAREAADALAKIAGKDLSAGKVEEAAKIASALQTRPESGLVALEAVLRSSGDLAATTILGILGQGDPKQAAIAAGFVANVNEAGIKQLADGLPGLSPEAQVRLLRALGPKRDRSALPAVKAAASSSDPSVRDAALAALGGVGDASTVPVLLKAIQGGVDASGVARRSLESVFADGIDAALIETVRSTTDANLRTQLVDVLGNRRAGAAVPTFLDVLGRDDANLRRAAISALEKVAAPDDLPAILAAIPKIADDGQRNEAARAVASICDRVPDEARKADAVLAAYRKASPGDRARLLAVVGRVGGSGALALVREAALGTDADHRTAAEHALLDWPDSSVAEDVAKLAEKAENPELRRAVVQALARVIAGPGPLDNRERLGYLERAFKQADRDEDRRRVLAAAREIHTFPAVRFAAAHLDEPKLRSQAVATVVGLLEHQELRDNHRDEADKLLDKVIAVSKDKSLLERARSFKSRP
ncbi:HEAT repeat domain-containing protein [Aquisphaera insulae]|uniref:HEAT repeat domain-containing protein n=1 Tax=Aquisphaera insulae TaxID=2712864 RepID=UPI0013E9DFD4|nr:HEAT repeat domain-containing protein [Aquisphaera insulae]